mmetsp:Transcript_2388/g.7141  ORF Transcript_2388/g.7141 Transcript_2388/m.7141 type:complete len:507 (-) Transcript_2388:218-1738(-)
MGEQRRERELEGVRAEPNAGEQPELQREKSAEYVKFLDDTREDFAERFEEKAEIGKGAFAVCLLCQDRATGINYAVKKIPKGRILSDTMRQTIALEYRIQRHLCGHKNIVEVYGTYEDRDFVYIVLELCDGGDMFDHLIAKGRYSEKDSSDLCRAMLTAVRHCHEKGVVHRDLKPDNFLFDCREQEPTLKTADFGLSCFHQEGAIQRQPCGTPTYIAPEVIKKEYNEKADIWSIGVILYIMLSGKMPFYGKNDLLCLKSTLRGQYNFKDPNWRTVSQEAKNVVKLMLTYNPARRPSAKELLELPWVKGQASTTPLVQSVIDNMKQFYNMNKLKKRAMQIMAENSTSENLDLVKKAFHEMDKDGSGTITVDEMKDALRAANKSFTEEYFERLWETYDVDGDGVINYTEFLTATSQLNKIMTAENMEKAFKEIDKDGNGRISVAEIVEALRGFKCDGAMVEQIVKEADRNNDGEIDYAEFEEMMRIREDLHNASDNLKGIFVDLTKAS